MAKYRVAVIGTVGKSVLIDDSLSSRVAALETQIANVGGVGAHSALTGLQQGDDHPQYTMWQAPETIAAPWNFSVIPFIQGEPLAEYIEDVVAGGTDPFIADSPSITWTYDDTGNHLQADVVDEYVEDLVGSMLVNTTYIDLDYGDSDGSIKAILDTGAVLDLVGGQLQDSSTIDFTYDSGTKRTSAAVIGLPAGVFANPSASIGLTAVNGSATTAMRSDAAPALAQTISPTMTGNWTFTPSSGNTKIHAGNLQLDVDNLELQLGASQDLRIYHDGTNSIIRNDTGSLILSQSGASQLALSTNLTVFGSGASAAYAYTLNTAAGFVRDMRYQSAGVDRWYFRVDGTAESGGNAGSDFSIIPRSDAGASLGAALFIKRSDSSVRLPNDNQELQLGASQDLRLYHDGTNSIIRTGTGGLRLQFSTNNRFEVNTTGVGFNGATPIARPDYTITNPTTNRSIDVSTITHAQLAQVVGTMIQDFINYGLYQ